MLMRIQLSGHAIFRNRMPSVIDFRAEGTKTRRIGARDTVTIVELVRRFEVFDQKVSDLWLENWRSGLPGGPEDPDSLHF